MFCYFVFILLSPLMGFSNIPLYYKITWRRIVSYTNTSAGFVIKFISTIIFSRWIENVFCFLQICQNMTCKSKIHLQCQVYLFCSSLLFSCIYVRFYDVMVSFFFWKGVDFLFFLRQPCFNVRRKGNIKSH